MPALEHLIGRPTLSAQERLGAAQLLSHARPSRLIVGTRCGKVSLCETPNGVQLWELQIDTWATSAVFSPDGRSVAMGCRDGTVTLLETATGTALFEFHREETVSALAYSPCGLHLAVGGLV